MSRRGTWFNNEGDNLTSEPQTFEVMVLATVPSTQEATTPLSCFIIAQLSVRYFFITSFTTPTLAKNYYIMFVELINECVKSF